VQPERFGRRVEQLGRFHAQQRRVGIIVRARSFQRVAAGEDLAPQIARLPGDAEQLFVLVVERLQLVVIDGIILAGHVVGEQVGAVAFGQVGAQAELVGHQTKCLPRPVRAGPADAGADLPRADVAHRQRLGVAVVAEGLRALRRLHHQPVALLKAQFVHLDRRREIPRRGQHGPAFQRDHTQPLRRQRLGHQRPGRAEPANHGVHRLFSRRHYRSP
jgi:hypothetical protein